MKARVTVTLKSGILDPQGKAIEGALKSLGVAGVASVRQGKVFDIELKGKDRKKAEAALKAAAGIETASLACFDLLEFGGPSRKSESDIIALSSEAVAKAREPDGILISCGGLRTLGVTKPLEDRHGLPVVSSTPAAFWSAMRLVGESGRVAGCGRLLEQATAPVH